MLVDNAIAAKSMSDQGKPSRSFRIHILTIQDQDDCFSTIALNLPGAGSCGRTEVEAIENAKDAIRGAIQCYEEAHEAIPWLDSSREEIPAGAKQEWITVDA